MSKADVQAAVDACVAIGWMVQVKPGLYRMTQRGEQAVEAMPLDAGQSFCPTCGAHPCRCGRVVKRKAR